MRYRNILFAERVFSEKGKKKMLGGLCVSVNKGMFCVKTLENPCFCAHKPPKRISQTNLLSLCHFPPSLLSSTKVCKPPSFSSKCIEAHREAKHDELSDGQASYLYHSWLSASARGQLLPPTLYFPLKVLLGSLDDPC